MIYSRFSSSTGCHYNPEYLTSLSDEELANAICGPEGWDDDYFRELVWRADILEDGLLKTYVETEEWEDTIPIIKKAAEILGIKIDL